MERRAASRAVPTSLKHALELCKAHARDVRNFSVERIADEMGVEAWTLYKWLNGSSMPLKNLRAFERVCGVNYVTQWLAMSDDKLLISIPIGRVPAQGEMLALQEAATTAVVELLAFYRRRTGASMERTMAAIQTAMEKLAWHRGNVTKSRQPELDFSEG